MNQFFGATVVLTIVGFFTFIFHETDDQLVVDRLSYSAKAAEFHKAECAKNANAFVTCDNK